MSTLTFNHRTAEQGSFIWFSDDFNLSLDTYSDFYALTPRQKETVEALISCYEVRDSESTTDLTHAIEKLGVSRSAFNRRLTVLYQVNILTQKEFTFANSPLRGRTKCIAFAPMEDSLESLQEKSEQRKKTYSEKRSRSMALTTMYNEAGFTRRPDPVNSPIVSPVDSSLGLIEQSVAPLKSHQQKIAKMVFVPDTENKPHQLAVQGASATRVANADDLMNYYAMLSLAHEYHYLSIDEHIKNQTLPTNATPIYVDDIVRVRKRLVSSIGSHYRKDVRDSIKAMKHTSYELMGLPALFSNGVELKEGFTSKTFRIFEDCRPFSEVAPRLKDDQNVEFADDASLFIVTFPDHIFEKLIHGDSIFAYPANSLSVSALLFSIYVRFRIKLRNCSMYSESIETIRDKIASGSEYHNFKESLVSNFTGLSALKDAHAYGEYDGRKLEFNLWGYYGEFDFQEHTLRVEASSSEVLLCSGIDPDVKANGRVQTAPTIHNRLAAQLRPHLLVNKRVSNRIASELNIQSSQYCQVLGFDGHEYEISHYSSDLELKTVKEALRTRFGLPMTSYDTFISQQLDKVNVLTIGNTPLTRDKFALIRSRLFDVWSVNVSPSVILNSMSRKRSFHPQLVDFINGAIEDMPKEFYLAFRDVMTASVD